MSRMQSELSLPQGWTIPHELERAWQWMEDQGFGSELANGYYLTPYAGTRVLGIVFSPNLTLDGWFRDGDPGADQLVPIAEVSGSGSIGALWLPDDGDLRYVVLGGDGVAATLAESTLDFLTLIGIGYVELDYAGGEPDDEDAVEAVASFRAWVEAEFGIDVPDEWPDEVPGNDDFTAWVAARSADAPPA